MTSEISEKVALLFRSDVDRARAEAILESLYENDEVNHCKLATKAGTSLEKFNEIVQILTKEGLMRGKGKGAYKICLE